MIENYAPQSWPMWAVERTVSPTSTEKPLVRFGTVVGWVQDEPAPEERSFTPVVVDEGASDAQPWPTLTSHRDDHGHVWHGYVRIFDVRADAEAERDALVELGATR